MDSRVQGHTFVVGRVKTPFHGTCLAIQKSPIPNPLNPIEPKSGLCRLPFICRFVNLLNHGQTINPKLGTPILEGVLTAILPPPPPPWCSVSGLGFTAPSCLTFSSTVWLICVPVALAFSFHLPLSSSLSLLCSPPFPQHCHIHHSSIYLVDWGLKP